MANIVHPTIAELYYSVVDSNGNKIVSNHLLHPPVTLTDNSDDLYNMTGVVRGNLISMLNYWVQNAVDPDMHYLEGYEPESSWNGLNADQIDTVLKMDLAYYTENPPSGNFILDLSNVSNEAPNNNGNNENLLALIALFAQSGFIYTAIIN